MKYSYAALIKFEKIVKMPNDSLCHCNFFRGFTWLTFSLFFTHFLHRHRDRTWFTALVSYWVWLNQTSSVQESLPLSGTKRREYLMNELQLLLAWFSCTCCLRYFNTWFIKINKKSKNWEFWMLGCSRPGVSKLGFCNVQEIQWDLWKSSEKNK